MLNFDLNKFKKTASDNKTTTLVSPQGHELRIAHPLLSEEMRKKIHEIPLSLAHGGEGEVDSSDQEDTQSNEVNDSTPNTRNPTIIINAAPPTNTPPNQPFALGPEYNPENAEMTKLQMDNTIASNVASNPESPANALASNEQAPAGNRGDQTPQNNQSSFNPFDNPDYFAGYKKAFDEVQQGLGQKYQADVKAGQLRQQANQDYFNNIDYENDIWNGIAMNSKELADEQLKVLQDDKTGHIHPNQYLENMETGQRIATAIGLMLGGMGGGLTHTENPALKFLNDQIQRDVYSQEKNINSNQNLLSAYQKQFQDAQMSRKMALSTQYALYSAKIQDAADQTSDLVAKANLLKGKAFLDTERTKLNNEMAIKQMAMRGINSPNNDPASQIRFMTLAGIMNPKDSEQASKELGQHQNLMNTRDFAVKSFDHIKNQFMNGVLSPQDTESAKWSIAGKIQKDTEGRFNMDAAYKLVDSIFPNWKHGDDTSGNKRERLFDLFDTMAATPTLDKYKIKIPSSSNQNKFNEMSPVKR